jgi:DNA-binding transcriptional LysR family regulator
VFHAVAMEGSFSRAAERLMVSQPAVSKQLALLERKLKTVLVDRGPRGVHLTAAGEVLAGYARRIFGLEEEAERAMAELTGLSRGRLLVAATPTIGIYWLPGVLVRYRRAHPGVEMRMEVHPSETIGRLLGEVGGDGGLGEAKVEDEGVESRVLMKDRMVAVAAPSGPLSRKRTLSVEQLCREPFAVREVGSGSKSLVERALAERGLAVSPAMSLGSTEAIKRAVMEGVGAAIVSGLAVRSEIEAGRLVELKVRGLKIEREVYLLLARGRNISVAAAAFVRLLNETAASTGQ